jgi:hypothetical protein
MEIPPIHYMQARSLKNTFDDPDLAKLVTSMCEGKTLNLFAGRNRLQGVDEFRVDLSEEFGPDYHGYAEDFLIQNKEKFNTIVYDAPWENHIRDNRRQKDLIVEALEEDGRIICISRFTTEFGEHSGMEIVDLTLVDPEGGQRPFYVTVEQKVSSSKAMGVARPAIAVNQLDETGTITTISKKEALQLSVSIQGWCTREELSWIYDRASALVQNSIWVELGTWKGRSICPALMGAPDSCQVFSVDTLAGHPKSVTRREASYGWWVLDHVHALSKLSMTLGKGGISCLRQESVAGATHFRDGQLDVVYLDRDYRDEGEAIALDVAAWGPKLKSGGTLCGRNYGIPFSSGGLENVIDDLLPDRELGPGSIWYWNKH